nr:hypothetical protein [Pseudomonadota bacterium]
MKAAFPGFALLLAAVLAGCASLGGRSDAGGVDVTRTHLGQPLARAHIAVEPLNAADANSPEFQAFAAMVERHLARHGYTIAS